jgi:hypothetical protein
MIAHLLNYRLERIGSDNGEAFKRHLGGGQAPAQWTHIERLGRGDPALNLLLPGSMGDSCLVNTFRGQMSVDPVIVGISILQGPVRL